MEHAQSDQMKPRTGQWLWFEPIYRFNVALLCCKGDEATKRVARVLPADCCEDVTPVLMKLGCDGRFIGAEHASTGRIALFWFSPGADVAVIAHEALHATYWLLKCKGLTLDDSSEEAYAYFHEWLVREILKRRQR